MNNAFYLQVYFVNTEKDAQLITLIIIMNRSDLIALHSKGIAYLHIILSAEALLFLFALEHTQPLMTPPTTTTPIFFP